MRYINEKERKAMQKKHIEQLQRRFPSLMAMPHEHVERVIAKTFNLMIKLDEIKLVIDEEGHIRLKFL